MNRLLTLRIYLASCRHVRRDRRESFGLGETPVGLDRAGPAASGGPTWRDVGRGLGRRLSMYLLLAFLQDAADEDEAEPAAPSGLCQGGCGEADAKPAAAPAQKGQRRS